MELKNPVSPLMPWTDTRPWRCPAEQMLLSWTMQVPPSSDDHSIIEHFIPSTGLHRPSLMHGHWPSLK
jgi:hypothetical protein